MDTQFKLQVDKRLTTIASNDRIIAINSNHDVSDSGFILSAVEHCFDDDILKAFNSDPNLSSNEKLAPIRESIAFKKEIERAERNKPALHSYSECTSFPYDVNDPHFVKKDQVQLHFDDGFPVETLTCYDKKLKRPKQMNFYGLQLQRIKTQWP